MKNYKYDLERRKILEHEKGFRAIKKNAALVMAIVYPNTYQLAMSNLGYQNMYYYYNQSNDIYCDRCFLVAGLPKDQRLNSLEMDLSLDQFDLLAFSVSFELDYVNILKILKMAGIEPDRRKRKGPVLMAGGPAVTSNPEPLSMIFDAFYIGEAEASASNLAEGWIGADGVKEVFVECLDKMPGYYIPSFFDPDYDGNRLVGYVYAGSSSKKVKRQWRKNINELDIFSRIITPDTEFSDMFLLEIGRGCGRQCRFCMAGYIYRCPRNRDIASLISIIEKYNNYTDKIGLVSAAVSDYPEMDKLCEYLADKGFKVSVSSFRADTVSSQLIELLAASGQKTVTIAPEAGSEKLIRSINKNITRDHIEQLLISAIRVGIKSIRYYTIIGLPGEDESDIYAIADMAKWTVEIYKKNKINNCEISISTSFFIPKANTPFQWFGMMEQDILKRRLKMLQALCAGNGNISISGESAKWSYIQSLMARGDRRIGEILLGIGDDFGNINKWNIMLEEKYSENISYYINRGREFEESFPWDIIDQGISKKYLLSEYEKSLNMISSNICCVAGCHTCGNRRL